MLMWFKPWLLLVIILIFFLPDLSNCDSSSLLEFKKQSTCLNKIQKQEQIQPTLFAALIDPFLSVGTNDLADTSHWTFIAYRKEEEIEYVERMC